MIEAAQTLAGITFTREEQQAIATRLNATRGYLAGFRFLMTADLGNDTQPAVVFNPVPPGKTPPAGPRGLKRREPLVSKPSSDEALAFLPVTHLAKLVKSRQIKPSELTELYLARLTAHDPALHCIQANRYRMRVIEQIDAAMSGLDLFIGANQLLTNRTGHPVISLPNGFFNGSPTALQMTGKLFGEPELLLLAHAFQSKDRSPFEASVAVGTKTRKGRVCHHCATERPSLRLTWQREI